jgi:Protein of unknown function (DUF2783)
MNTQLNTQPHIDDVDGFYEHLLDAHAGLSRDASEALNARLILLLVNQIGNATLLRQCVDEAKVNKL